MRTSIVPLIFALNEEHLRNADASLIGNHPSFVAESSANSIQAEANFSVRLRRFLDDLNHLKYLNHFKWIIPRSLSSDEAVRLELYKTQAEEIRRTVWMSLGGFEDSLLGLENFFANLDLCVEKPDLSHLKLDKIFDAVVVSAGPSLDLEHETLKVIQEKVLIICVDAALKNLLEKGITPDLVVAIERDDHSISFFRNLKQSLKTHLLAHTVCKRELFDSYPGPIATSYKYTGPYLWLPFKRARFWTGSSSAHLAFRAAHYLGAQRVALVGQDLCYHPHTLQSHAYNADYPEWSTGQTSEELARSTSLISKPGNIESKVFTNSTWLMFSHDFQSMLSDLKSPTTNTSTLGMKIPGMPFQRLSEWAKDLINPSGPFIKDLASNPNQSKDKILLQSKMRDGLSALLKITQKLGKNLSSEEVQNLYSTIPSSPHFLELGYEVVFRDWVETENKIHAIDDHKIEIDCKRIFLEKLNLATTRLIELLKRGLEKL